MPLVSDLFQSTSRSDVANDPHDFAKLQLILDIPVFPSASLLARIIGLTKSSKSYSGDRGVAMLTGWESFYVIIGTSAAVLIGLQFVVVTLAAQMQLVNPEGSSAFATPNIVHFCAILFVAAVLSSPWDSLATVAVILGLCGVAGLVYAGVVLRRARRHTSYTPVLEDWIFHFTLPPIAYAILLLAAIMLPSSPAMPLFVVAAAVLLLLFVGIHNAWDSATYIALNESQQQERHEEEK